MRYQVGIRNRGNGSADELPNNIHVDFPRDAPWNGLDALNFNTQFTHLQLAGLKLFQKAGFVAEDSAKTLVRVNGVDLSFPGSPSYGIYMYLEAADDVFVSNHFPEDDGGNLYRVKRDASDRAWGDFRDLGVGRRLRAVLREADQLVRGRLLGPPRVGRRLQPRDRRRVLREAVADRRRRPVARRTSP